LGRARRDQLPSPTRLDLDERSPRQARKSAEVRARRKIEQLSSAPYRLERRPGDLEGKRPARGFLTGPLAELELDISTSCRAADELRHVEAVTSSFLDGAAAATEEDDPATFSCCIDGEVDQLVHCVGALDTLLSSRAPDDVGVPEGAEPSITRMSEEFLEGVVPKAYGTNRAAHSDVHEDGRRVLAVGLGQVE
jgi:hypothetical protein